MQQVQVDFEGYHTAELRYCIVLLVAYPSALCKSKPKQCFNQIYMLCRAIHERHEKDVSLSNTLFILALSQRHEYMT